MGKSFLICSGKGGVGKTATAINLGAALSSFNKEIMIVDANLPTPNIGLQLGIPAEVKTFNDVMHGTASVSKASYPFGSKLKILPASFSVESLSSFDNAKFKQILKNIQDENDLTFVDCAPGLGTEVINSLRSCSNAIVVLNPELPSLADACKIIEIAQDLNVKIEGIIVNRVGRFKKELTLGEICDVLPNVKVLGTVPEDRLVPTSIALGQPLVFKYPYSNAGIAFKKIAASLIGKKYTERRSFVKKVRAFIDEYRA